MKICLVGGESGDLECRDMVRGHAMVARKNDVFCMREMRSMKTVVPMTDKNTARKVPTVFFGTILERISRITAHLKYFNAWFIWSRPPALHIQIGTRSRRIHDMA